MQNGDQNKMMTGASNKKQEVLNEYFLPEYGRTVYAHSLDEALAIIDKERNN